MRVYFFILLSIFLISLASVLVVDSFTGALLTTPGCQSGCTPVFYRTPEEKVEVEGMYYKAGFAIMGYGPAPQSFRKSGYYEFACACPRPLQERGVVQFNERPRVVSSRGSV